MQGISGEMDVVASQDATTLFAVSIGDGLSISVDVHGVLWLGFVVLLAIFVVVRYHSFNWFESYEIDEAEFGFGDQKIKVRPNTLDAQIAFSIWVELSTRKIGLPISEEDDVISEVYDSWYSFFGVTRSMIKEIPVTKARRKDTEAIIKLSIDVLNKGLRPHLTKWQAKYRKWFTREVESEENEDLSPQEIQRQYPEHQKLMADLLAVNKTLIKYRKQMYRLAIGRQAKH